MRSDGSYGEIPLFDEKGHPVAYIADDPENSIYLWGGQAVAYIQGENIYGWNGRHLGWFSGGVLHDLQGYRVGSIAEKCPYAASVPPAKVTKLAKRFKFARHKAYARPFFSRAFSDVSLEQFLRDGDFESS